MTLSEAAIALLGAEYKPSWSAIEQFLPHLEGYRYEFLDPDEFRRILEKDTSYGMAIYWREILHRAHWAAAGSLIRTHRWLRGMFEAFAAGNLIVFCACTRGLVEAAADSWDSLNPVAPTLAACRRIICAALDHQLHEQRIAAELENRLIHFTFARKPGKGQAVPDQHQAKAVTDYLRHFEKEQPSMRQFYAMLCDVVHPGSRSVLSFTKPEANGSRVVLTFEAEQRSLAEFAYAFRLIVADVMAAGFNTGMFILRTLNALPATEVHTSCIESLPYKNMAAWQVVEDLLTGRDSRAL